jgi:hypothetical protein
MDSETYMDMLKQYGDKIKESRIQNLLYMSSSEFNNAIFKSVPTTEHRSSSDNFTDDEMMFILDWNESITEGDRQWVYSCVKDKFFFNKEQAGTLI